MGSLRADCCVNITGDPGELWCGLSSFTCKGTGTGDTACCGSPVVVGSDAGGCATARNRNDSNLVTIPYEYHLKGSPDAHPLRKKH